MHGALLAFCAGGDQATQGYALVEYAERSEAEAAIRGMGGAELMGNRIKVDWAFKEREPPSPARFHSPNPLPPLAAAAADRRVRSE